MPSLPHTGALPAITPGAPPTAEHFAAARRIFHRLELNDAIKLALDLAEFTTPLRRLELIASVASHPAWQTSAIKSAPLPEQRARLKQLRQLIAPEGVH